MTAPTQAPTSARLIPPSGSREVSVEQLEAMAFYSNVAIQVPPHTGGWARLVTSGGRWHCWVDGVAA